MLDLDKNSDSNLENASEENLKSNEKKWKIKRRIKWYF